MSAANDFNNGLGDVNSWKNSNKLIAFFGRANLSWDQTWFLSLSGRYEGSSKFGIDNKWGFFPGVSGGVELANFINSSAVNNLKFRVSYGETGNNLRDSYLSLVVVEPSGNSFFYNGEYVPAFGPLRNANPNLGWESKKERKRYSVGPRFNGFPLQVTAWRSGSRATSPALSKPSSD